MTHDKQKGGFELTKGVFIAYVILGLHVLLIAGIGLLVMFFRGVVNYMAWIFIGGTAILLTSVFIFYTRLKKQGKTLKDILNSSTFQGRSVEVSLLGGMASIKIGQPGGDLPELDSNVIGPAMQLEDPATVRTRELSELALLYEKELITLEEYTLAKQRLFNI